MKVVKFEFSLLGINTYIVYDPVSLECAIIDPGMMYEEEEKAMLDFINRNKLKVTHLINTHLHVDHAAGNKFISEQFKVPVKAHREDEFLGNRLQIQAAAFEISGAFDNVTISTYLEDGDIIKLGDSQLIVIHVPGHSPGSIALYSPEDNFVITGDALFAGSIGRTDFPGGNMQTLLDSIKNKLLTLPVNTVVYSGHGPETTIGIEKRSNPFL